MSPHRTPSPPAGVVDVCLIPEVKFDLAKLCKHVGDIIERKGHCVVCVAEGAGQVRGGSGALSVYVCACVCVCVCARAFVLRLEEEEEEEVV